MVDEVKSSQVKSQIIYFEHEKCVCHMILKDNDNNNDRRVIQHNRMRIMKYDAAWTFMVQFVLRFCFVANCAINQSQELRHLLR